jgi:flagellar biosynthesis/type III secretory pathway ATPase
MDRDPIRETIQTGVRSIDGLLTCGMDSASAYSAEAVVGKSTLLA